MRDKEQESLDEIKSEIARGEVLAQFETSGSCETFLTTDASEVGIGAVLEQRQQNGIIKPVSYWSSKLRKYELNYSISEKEALACVAAMKKFQKYLLGRKFTLRTDHKALTTLLGKGKTKISSARTERWREKISMFDYKVEYIKGKENTIADWLSRSSKDTTHDEVPLKEEYVMNEVRKTGQQRLHYNNKMKRLVKIIREDAWSDLEKKEYKGYYRKRKRITIADGLLFYDGIRFIPDESVWDEIVAEAHGLHNGIVKTKMRIKELFWWPLWTEKVDTHIKECSVCKESERTEKTYKPEISPVDLPMDRGKRWPLILKDPLRKYIKRVDLGTWQ